MAGNEPITTVQIYQSHSCGTGDVEYVASDGKTYHRCQPFEKPTHTLDKDGKIRKIQ
jgi:hypothetical protein